MRYDDGTNYMEFILHDIRLFKILLSTARPYLNTKHKIEVICCRPQYLPIHTFIILRFFFLK